MKFAGRALLGVCVVVTAAAVAAPPYSFAAAPKVALMDEPRPSDIRLQETELGFVFADSRGMTLYTDRDEAKPNVPVCTYDIPQPATVTDAEDIRAFPPFPSPVACRHKHKPVEVTEGSKPVGPWTIVEDTYGIKQWAYRSHVVYTSVKDLAPGQAWNDVDTGMRQYRKRFLTLFAPLDLPPDITLQTIGVARILGTFTGRTLYTLAQDRAGKSTCEGACLDQWSPYLGGALSQPRGEWTLVTRNDGTRQWAFRGKPLYTFNADRKAGDTKGNNLPGVEVAVTYSAPRPPSFVTVQTTPVGDVYADEKGMTLYAFICPGESGRECDDAGEKTNWWFVVCGNTPEKCAAQWRPVFAKENAKPAGNSWSIVTMPLPWSPVRATQDSKEPGAKVWAYKGRPLFTYAHEDRPGMIDGMDIGTLGGPRWFALYSTGAELNANSTITQAAR